MSEFERQELEDVENPPNEIPYALLSQQELVSKWAMQVVNTPYALTMKVLLDKLFQGIRHGTDFDGVSVMMDFFTEGKKDDDKFKGLAKEIKLVDICQPSYRFMYENWQPEEKKRAKWNFVEDRLLTGENLAKAVSLRLGGILLGLDKKRNLLVADGGVEPVYIADTYSETRETVIMQGYEILTPNYDDRRFAFRAPSPSLNEMSRFEIFTGEPFVRSESGGRVTVWFDSGPGGYMHSASCVHFYPDGRRVADTGEIWYPHPDYGIRRLFRAKA